jgi:AcrR family transcriptional regulator
VQTPRMGAMRAPAREALIDATKRLLVQSVHGGFTIDEVIREARVARGSFYNHFTSVDELIATTQQVVQTQCNDAIAAAIADSPDAATSMARGLVVAMRFGYEHGANARVLLVSGPGAADPAHPANRELTAALRVGIEDGELDLPSLEAGVIAVRGIVELGLGRMLDLRHELSSVRELTSGMCATMLRAIGVDRRRVARLTTDAMQRCFPAYGNER